MLEKLTFEKVNLLEGAKKEGKDWEVVIIESGPSKNGKIYSSEVLKKAVNLFDNAKCFVYQFADGLKSHLPEYAKNFSKGFVENLVGWFENPRFTAYIKDGVRKEGIVAKLHIAEGAERLKKLLTDAWENGKKNLLGLSIDAEGLLAGDQVISIDRVNSVDIVTHPAAGGAFQRLLADINPQKKEVKTKMKSLFEFVAEINPELVAGLKEDKLTPEHKLSFLKEIVKFAKGGNESLKRLKEVNIKDLIQSALDAVKNKDLDGAAQVLEEILAIAEKYGAYSYEYPSKESSVQAAKEGTEKESKEAEVVAERIRKVEENLALAESRSILKEKLEASRLPQPFKEKIRKDYEGKIFSSEDLEKSISSEQAAFAESVNSGNVKGLGSQMSVTLEESDKRQEALDKLLGAEIKQNHGVPAFRGLKEAYQTWYPEDPEVTGQVRSSRLTEGINVASPFTYALGTSINRRLVKEYNLINKEWENIVEKVPVKDFKLQELIRWGGYADLASVSDDAEYQYFGSDPVDERATYTIGTKGNLVYVTRKAIINDDLRILTRLPKKIAQSAARTLAKFVWNFISGNGAIYDSKALFHTDHANITTTLTLSYDNVITGMMAMKNQAEAGSSEKIGLKANYLVYPTALAGTANSILTSTYKPGGQYTEDNQIKPVLKGLENKFFTDDTNWYLIASLLDIDLIEIGFLFGKEEPEIFLQDQSTVSQVFTHDKITYKVRHEYGGAVVDYRGFYGSLNP